MRVIQCKKCHTDMGAPTTPGQKDIIFKCPGCGQVYKLTPQGKIEEVAE